MYDKSQLVEQIEKPAEPVNDNLKIQPTAGAEVKNNTVKCGINLFEESESMFSAKKPPAHL